MRADASESGGWAQQLASSHYVQLPTGSGCTKKRRTDQLVAEFFAVLGTHATIADFKLTPTVRQLKGALPGADVDVEDYRRHLEEKYL